MSKNQPLSIDPLAVYLPEEAAERLRVERRTVYKLIEEGQLPKRELGKGYKILGEDLLNYLGTPTISRMQPNFTTPSNVGAVSPENVRYEPVKSEPGVPTQK